MNHSSSVVRLAVLALCAAFPVIVTWDYDAAVVA
jgi:hypothetical protein